MRHWKAAAAIIALAGSSAVAVGATLNTKGSASKVSGPQEWVVQYTSPSAAVTARHSISTAGGRLTDEIPSAGVARVMAGARFDVALRGDPGIRAVTRNRSLGNARRHMPGVIATRRPANAPTYRPGTVQGNAKTLQSRRHRPRTRRGKGYDPLTATQWDMRMIDTRRAHRRQTGRNVTVGVIDTGIDAGQPDLAANFSPELSYNFTVDREDIDGPCADEEDGSCNDPADVDEGGHGTHVAGIIGAASNGVGTVGVAPDVTLVNLRAGQDSGYFFLFEVLAAIDAARQLKVDVINMSFYTDPWLYNCSTVADVISANVSPAALARDVAEQRITRELLLTVIAQAQDAGVIMVAAAGNDHVDMAAPTRTDSTSPDYGRPPYDRVVTKNCLDLPAEAPGVIRVSALGPSGDKAEYSNYGYGSIDVAAPGGYYRDFPDDESLTTRPENLILAPYPLEVGQAEGGFDASGEPTDPFYLRSCDSSGANCGYYTYLQGTSMAAPHAAGVAALIVGKLRSDGRRVTPKRVQRRLLSSARERRCPRPRGVFYPAIPEIRDAHTDTCVGSRRLNGFYGHGVLNAARAVRR